LAMLNRRSFVAALALAGAAGPAHAAPAYPDRTIRILVGYPPGGGVDIVARLLGERMRMSWQQNVVVENRSGAGAMIATGLVAKSPPDGYTLLMAASGEVAINHFLYKEQMTYDPARDLVPVALLGIVPCVVVVATGTPVHTPQELIAYARANPGKLSFSSSGIGNPQQLAGELMNHMAGVSVLHVPYRGSAPAVADVASGTVTMSFSSLAAALPLIQAGNLRAVAVTSKERMPQLPEIAPLRDGAPGLAGYELLNWFALFAPAKTPPEIVTQLNAIVASAVADPALRDNLMSQGIVPQPMGVDDFAAFVRSETAKFGQIIKDAGITLGN
ncbi:MAG: tripartite tricarboxylate transporter substrate binding protein, partial [Alphaproteobacteria bacterium]|nr:tripartite tricarboxylate transporter substrate binding protein [Alphaproteobacteria bacterium]